MPPDVISNVKGAYVLVSRGQDAFGPSFWMDLAPISFSVGKRPTMIFWPRRKDEEIKETASVPDSLATEQDTIHLFFIQALYAPSIAVQ